MRVKPINRGYFPIGNLSALWIAHRGILLVSRPYSKATQIPPDINNIGPNAYSLSFRGSPIEGTPFIRLVGCLITWSGSYRYQLAPHKPFKFTRVTGEPDED
jgi:hypothetical protein